MAMSKGQIEAEVSEALIRFEKEYMGRGPDETKTYLLDDMVVVRLQRVLTPLRTTPGLPQACTNAAASLSHPNPRQRCSEARTTV